MNHPTVSDLFGLLDQWRHLPAYQLERRADIFFALFLPEVLEAHFRRDYPAIKIDPRIIPEFPLRHGTLGTNTGNGGKNQSVKVDYAVFSKDSPRKMFLVELKTDSGSRRDKQDEYLEQAKNTGLWKLVDGIIDIYTTPSLKSRQKYVHLLKILRELRLVKFCDTLYEKAFPEIKPGVMSINVENSVESDTEIQIVYVQPIAEGHNEIGFQEFADCVEERDGIGKEFACYLREWTNPAGKRDLRENFG